MNMRNLFSFAVLILAAAKTLEEEENENWFINRTGSLDESSSHTSSHPDPSLLQIFTREFHSSTLENQNFYNESSLNYSGAVPHSIECGGNTWEITRIQPSRGSELGGTPVTVFLKTEGENPSSFDLSEIFRCNFGGELRPLLISKDAVKVYDQLDISDGHVGDNGTATLQIGCLSPPFSLPGAIPGPVPFSLICKLEKDNKVPMTLFTSSKFAVPPNLTFQYMFAASIHAIHPKVGGPGTQVTIMGSGFYDSSALACFVGSVAATNVEFVSEEMIRFIAPVQDDGEYRISLSNNGIDLEGYLDNVSFVYVPFPVVERVYPELVAGNTAAITVIGNHFATHEFNTPLCSFGQNITSSAIVESNNRISCATPNFSHVKFGDFFSTTVRVSTNGGTDFSTSSSRVVFYPPIRLLSVHPVAAPEMGSILKLHAENTFQSNDLACLFQLDGDLDYLSTPATLTSTLGEVECATPSSRSGKSKLWLTIGGHHSSKSSESIPFEFLDHVSVTSMNPSSGPMSGGTSVTLYGNGFKNDGLTLCRFGAAIAPAMEIANSTTITCVSPPIATALRGKSVSSAGAAVKVDISNNGGQQFSCSDVYFRYTEIALVVPNTTSVLGGSSVFLQGDGVGKESASIHHKLMCHFKVADIMYFQSQISVIDESTISCPSPHLPDLNHVPIKTEISVEFKNTTIFAESRDEVIILPPPILLGLSPLGGSELGGTEILVRGSNFREGVPCIFGGIMSPSILVSSSQIKCTSPPKAIQASHTTTVNVTVGTGMGLSNTLEFIYLPVSVIFRLTPTLGTSGTPLHMHGYGFHEIRGVQPLCMFSFSGGDEVQSPATILSDSLVTCNAPPSDSNRRARVGISLNGGHDVITSGEVFLYHRPISVESVKPIYVPNSIGAMLNISLTNIACNENVFATYHCSIGNIVIAATCYSGIGLTCFAPPLNTVGLLDLRLSQNGVDFHEIGHVAYHKEMEISWIDDARPTSIMVHGANFVDSVDISCIFRDNRENIFEESPASFMTDSLVFCGSPSVDTKITTLEVSVSRESLPTNPKFPFPYSNVTSADALKSTEITLGIDPSPNNDAFNDEVDKIGMIALTVKSVEPRHVPESGGLIAIAVVGAGISQSFRCIFNPIGNQKTVVGITSMESDVSDLKLVSCELPPTLPGVYSLALNIGHGQESLNDIAEITVYAQFSVNGFSPPSGTPGTKISIKGSNFPNITEMCCRIGTSDAIAKFMSSEELSCVIPTTQRSQSRVDLSVSINCHNFVPIGAVSVHERPAISTVIPPAATAGADIVLKGSNLLPTSTSIVHVSFNDTIVIGHAVNNTSVRVRAPVTVNGTSLILRVSTDGGSAFSDSHTILFIRELPVVSAILPSHGPANGRNKITLSGSGFASSRSPLCRFGQEVVMPVFVRPDKVVCNAPRNDVGHKSIDVAFSNDGIDWSNSLRYNYFPKIDVIDIFPSSLPVGADVSIRISGVNFFDSLFCQLGQLTKAKAIVIDDKTMHCMFPPMIEPGNVKIDILWDETSMLEKNFYLILYNAIESPVFPSFGSIRGGTMIKVETAVVINDRVDVSCTFSTLEPIIFQSIASKWNDKTWSCITPNMTSVFPATSYNYAKVGLSYTSDTGLPLSNLSPFFFKSSPSVKSIFPRSGPISGGTIVRVDGTDGVWLNSTLLSCFFGNLRVSAAWISPTMVDCISPESTQPTKWIVSVSDNGIDLSTFGDAFIQFQDPKIHSVFPKVGFSSASNIITLIGENVHSSDSVKCSFKDINSDEVVVVNGIFLNETALNCKVSENDFTAAVYLISYSLNAGVDWCETTLSFVTISSPLIESLSHEHGIANNEFSAIVLGKNLAVGGSLSFCQLIDQDGVGAMKSSATPLDDGSGIACKITCPSATTLYHVIVSVENGVTTVSSSRHPFWCVTEPAIHYGYPKFIAVGESTPIVVYGNFHPGIIFECRFGGRIPSVTPARHMVGSSSLECLSPAYSSPQTISLEIIGLAETIHLNVIDPVRVDATIPAAIFSGSDSIIIKGNNFLPRGMICSVQGKETVLEVINGTHAICKSVAKAKPSSVTLHIFFKDARQISSASNITLHPTPLIETVSPTSDLVYGGTTLVAKGRNFRKLGRSFCAFGDIVVEANIHSSTHLSCVTPEVAAGNVPVQFSLDNGMTMIGHQSFSFVQPIILHSVSPKTVVNGTDILLGGEGFRRNVTIKCSFGNDHDDFSLAKVLSSTTASCPVIARSFGYIGLSVVTSDNMRISNAIPAEIYNHPLVAVTANKALVGSDAGGQDIELLISSEADELLERSVIKCLFGHLSVPATVSKSVLKCMTPPWEPQTPRNVTLTVTLNGMEFSKNVLNFEYIEAPRVTKIHPVYVSTLGGTNVVVSGVNLLSLGRVSCRFGNHQTYGYFDSTLNSVACLTPSIDQKEGETHEYPLFLLLNGIWIDSEQKVYFHEPIHIESLAPRGISHGVESILVHGSGFSAVVPIHCHFNHSLWSTAVIISNKTAKCPLPMDKATELEGEELSLSLTTNKVDFFKSPYPLRYSNDDMYLTHINPKIGPSFGGTRIDVYGYFKKDTKMKCMFGDKSTRAIYLSNNHIKCMSSPIFMEESGRVMIVNVSVSGSHSLQQSAGFIYYSTHFSNDIEISTTHGATSGGTILTIGGKHLTDVLDGIKNIGNVAVTPIIKFGTKLASNSQVIDTNSIVCNAPSRDGNFSAVPIYLSLNGGVDFFPLNRQFHYYEKPSITKIVPLAIEAEEVVEIIIYGNNFLPLMDASCVFGSMSTVRAEVISATEIRCIVLPTVVGVIMISVTLNGVDNSNELPLAIRDSAPIVLAVEPVFVSASGGTVVTVSLSKSARPGTLIKLSNFTAEPQEHIGNSSFTFTAPSGSEPTQMLISHNQGHSFIDTMIALQFLPDLVIHAVLPSVFYNNDGERNEDIEISGRKFDPDWRYYCIILSNDKDIAEIEAVYKNETSITCNCKWPSINRPQNYGVAVRREKDRQTSNTLHIIATPRITLLSLNPSFIIEDSVNQYVSIEGKNLFVVVDSLICRFVHDQGHIETSIGIVVGSFVRCEVPRFPRGKISVHVIVANDSINEESNMLFLEISERLSFPAPQSKTSAIEPYDVTNENVFISGFEPTQVTGDSCFRLILRVENLYSDPSNCSIGDTLVQVESSWVTGSVSCLACRQELSNNNYSVGVVLGDGSIILAPSKLNVFPIEFGSAGPLFGPIGGGTRIQVSGKGFWNWNGRLFCYFGSDYSVAEVIDDSNVKCNSTPLFESISRSSLLVPFYVAPASVNEISATMWFTYHYPEEINAIFPRAGFGGTLVTITGSGFLVSRGYRCRFGEMMTSAIRISEEKIICIAPNLEPSSVPVSVTNNEVDFVYAGSFLYFHEVSILSAFLRGPPRTTVKVQLGHKY